MRPAERVFSMRSFDRRGGSQRALRRHLALAMCLWTFGAFGVSARTITPNVETVVRGLQFPEGTIMVGDALYFVDYASSDVMRLVDGRARVVWHQDGCGANGLVLVGQALLVACYDSNTVVAISPKGAVLETIERDDRGHGFHAPNDFAADVKGGVYFSCSGSSSEPGKVYYRAASRQVREVASNIRYSNGLAVSPDGKTLYVVESVTARILTYAIASDGDIGARKDFLLLPEILERGRDYTPDGLRTDRFGNLFIGLYNGGGFAVVAPDGTVLEQVSLPGPHHANLAITPDGKSVYVTAAYDDGGHTGAIVRVPNPVRQ